MANSLTNIMPKLLARGLMALREQAIMPRLVNGDYGTEAAMKGSTIDVPIPSAIAATAVTPSNTPPAPVDSTPGLVQVPLDRWFHADFHLTDKEQAEVDRDAHFRPMQMQEAIRSLANQVNTDLMDEYKGIYGYVGTASTTPFASTVTGATDLRKELHKQLCMRQNRRAVIDFDAEANMLALAAFSNLEQTGDAAVKIDGEVGRKFGFDWYTDDNVVTHTAGTAASMAVNGTPSIGATRLNQDSGTGTLLLGDIITIAGDDQTYVITDGIANVATTTHLEFSPGLKIAPSDNSAITVKATHVVNLGFHRDAFAFANRPLTDSSSQDLGSRILGATDPKTGISLRLEVSRQYKQIVWDFDILYGVKLVRPELAARLAG